ncbi:MAG: hypothetical protein AAB209_01875 [Bacteroidota bacterium]
MILLDENIIRSQRELLQLKRISFRQIGINIGKSGTKDEHIVPFLLKQSRPTFFTLDVNFFRPQLRHKHYCLVYLDVERKQVAEFIERFLKHPVFKTKAQRLGTVSKIMPSGISIWKMNAASAVQYLWRQK